MSSYYFAHSMSILLFSIHFVAREELPVDAHIAVLFGNKRTPGVAEEVFKFFSLVSYLLYFKQNNFTFFSD